MNGNPFGPSMQAQKDKHGMLMCPACDQTGWNIGPSGGISTNLTCIWCEAKWNYTAAIDLMEPICEKSGQYARAYNDG